MPVTHARVSVVVAAPANPNAIGGSDWNASHASLLLSTVHAVTSNVGLTEEVVECSGTITLTTYSAAANNGKVLYFLKTDAGTVTTLQDTAGALFNGDSTYQMTRQWEWLKIQSNGTRWNILGSGVGA